MPVGPLQSMAPPRPPALPPAPAVKGCNPAPPKEGTTYSEADWNETSTVGLVQAS